METALGLAYKYYLATVEDAHDHDLESKEVRTRLERSVYYLSVFIKLRTKFTQ